MNVEEVIFDVAEALRSPVLVLALAALALVLVEAGAFAVGSSPPPARHGAPGVCGSGRTGGARGR